jgi:hypothetical protein
LSQEHPLMTRAERHVPMPLKLVHSDETAGNRGPVQPHSMVDKSAFSPTGLTIPLDPVYPCFNPSIFPFSNSEDPDAPPCVVHPARVLPPALPAPALFSLVAPYWSYPVESSSEDAQHAPPSPEASHRRRLPCLSSGLHCLVRCGTCANASTSLE